ncbi:MAG: glycosyltransferase family 2 protein [Ignavibacteriaceae bacterium]|nr:glycosyltransferase family 2 protein [Ignavibacteriaceae bacterium]
MKNDHPLVSIILVNYNSSFLTLECIKSIFSSNYQSFKIIVVDNNSTLEDYNSITKTVNAFNWELLLFRNKINTGFASACNIGIDLAIQNQSDFVLLLNNDTTVTETFLEELINFTQSRKQACVTSSLILYSEHPHNVWFAGGYISKLRASGFHIRLTNPTTRLGFETEFLSGCCMLLPASVIAKVGKLSEEYFLYLEDVDYCTRLKNSGIKMYVVPTSVIYHKVNATTKKYSSHLPLYYNSRNRLYYSKKYFPKYFIFTLIYLILTFTLKSLLELFSNKNNFHFYQKAILDYFRGIKGEVNYFD